MCGDNLELRGRKVRCHFGLQQNLKTKCEQYHNKIILIKDIMWEAFWFLDFILSKKLTTRKKDDLNVYVN